MPLFRFPVSDFRSHQYSWYHCTKTLQNVSMRLFIHNRSLNMRYIVNLRAGGERGHSYAQFMYRTLCDQSQTGGLNWAGDFRFEFKCSYDNRCLPQSATQPQHSDQSDKDAFNCTVHAWKAVISLLGLRRAENETRKSGFFPRLYNGSLLLKRFRTIFPRVHNRA